jgi:hypothetical protein
LLVGSVLVHGGQLPLLVVCVVEDWVPATAVVTVVAVVAAVVLDVVAVVAAVAAVAVVLGSTVAAVAVEAEAEVPSAAPMASTPTIAANPAALDAPTMRRAPWAGRRRRGWRRSMDRSSAGYLKEPLPNDESSV